MLFSIFSARSKGERIGNAHLTERIPFDSKAILNCQPFAERVPPAPHATGSKLHSMNRGRHIESDREREAMIVRRRLEEERIESWNAETNQPVTTTTSNTNEESENGQEY